MLSLLFGLFYITAAGAQEAGARLSVTTEPYVVTVGNTWTLTISVDYPIVDDVSIAAPIIPPELSQTRFLKFPRGTGARSQTVFEYRFTANRSGRVLLESFVIVTPFGNARTGPVAVNIQESETTPVLITLRLSWEGAPARLAAGDSAAFVLRAPGGMPLNGIPQEFFMPEVPPGVILSSITVTPQERESGTVLKLNLIPIDADLSLEPRILRIENYVFEIPGIVIRKEESLPRTTQTNTNQHEQNRRAEDAVNGLERYEGQERGEDSVGDLFDPVKIKQLGKTRLLRLIFVFASCAGFIVIFTWFACLLIRQRRRA
jgi:hypothetical protein